MEKVHCSTCGWSALFETLWHALEGLAQHYLKEHPEVAHDTPVVQKYARVLAEEAAPTNGAMVAKPND